MTGLKGDVSRCFLNKMRVPSLSFRSGPCDSRGVRAGWGGLGAERGGGNRS